MVKQNDYWHIICSKQDEQTYQQSNNNNQLLALEGDTKM